MAFARVLLPLLLVLYFAVISPFEAHGSKVGSSQADQWENNGVCPLIDRSYITALSIWKFGCFDPGGQQAIISERKGRSLLATIASIVAGQYHCMGNNAKYSTVHVPVYNTFQRFPEQSMISCRLWGKPIPRYRR